jgi:GNAT superfamily N-acetyltransferase
LTGFVFPFDPAFAERLFHRYLRGGFALCLVHDVDGAPQGVLMAHAFEHDFGPVWLSQERVWWIDPAHRGSAAPRMLDAYETWAASKGCTFAGMAGMGDDPVVMKLYQRRGYRVAEMHCLKALA